MKTILCKLNIHRPLKGHVYNFTDKVSGKIVYDAICPCKKVFMVDSIYGWLGFKVKKEK